MNSDTVNIKKLIIKQSLELDCGKSIKNFPLAYETYGTLNKDKNNAILTFHALSGDQFVTGINPITKRKGWWTFAAGPGKAIDTNKYFVICANVLGGCMGSFGPTEINPETNKIFGTTFPVITIKDIVKAQKFLIDHLGIKKLLAVVGGSIIAFSEVFLTYAYKKFFIYILPSNLEPDSLIQFISTDYKFAISFIILVIVLIFRPTGIFRGKTL